jgi:hypothetical protein
MPHFKLVAVAVVPAATALTELPAQLAVAVRVRTQPSLEQSLVAVAVAPSVSLFQEAQALQQLAVARVVWPALEHQAQPTPAAVAVVPPVQTMAPMVARAWS